MAAMIKHLVAEWERHPDMFAFPLTCQYNGLAALRVARMASDRFRFPMPEVVVNPRRWQSSECLGEFEEGQPTSIPCKITLRGGFTVGEFLHELAHAMCFSRYGNHDHGGLHYSAMDDLCWWFRLEEKAQAAFFP